MKSVENYHFVYIVLHTYTLYTFNCRSSWYKSEHKNTIVFTRTSAEYTHEYTYLSKLKKIKINNEAVELKIAI